MSTQHFESPSQVSSPPTSGSPSGTPASSSVRQSVGSQPLEVQLSMLSPRPVQRKGGEDTAAVQEAAAQGIASGGGALPHAGAIQASFGAHDISSVQAHTGAAARSASAAMGAEAYATGDHVAFGGAPDLHTAAHEAAHVVQQRAGVSLSGGVGQVGDKYEQHADQVADAVVQGKSAEPILDQMAGGPSVQRRAVQRVSKGNAFFGVVQRLAGNLDAPVNGAVAPGHQGQTVGQAAAEMHPGARDASFNPARKVEFENRLAQLVLGSPDAYMGTVQKVSNGVLDYIEAESAAGLSNANAQMVALIMSGKNYFGRWVDELKTENQDAIAADMKRVLRAGGGGVSQHLMVHAKFNWEIYTKNWQDKVKQEFMKGFVAKNKYEALPPEGEGSLRDQAQVTAGGTTAGNLFEGANRGRIGAGKPGSQVSGSVPVSGNAAGVGSQQGGAAAPALAPTPTMRPEDQQALTSSHERGTNRWTVDETATFCQQARLVLNMPLSGGGPSGTTSDLLTIAVAFGAASAEERMQYALACQGVLGAAGAHTFHEIMTIAATIGVPYNPGNYDGVYPRSFAGQVAALKREFADVFPDGTNVATPSASAPAAAAPAGA